MNHIKDDIRKYWKEILFFGLIFSIYSICTTPGYTWSCLDNDCFNFVYAAKFMATPHVPGYPLQTILSIAVINIPIGMEGWRLAWFLSAIPALISCILVFVIVRKLTENRWSPWIASISLAGCFPVGTKILKRKAIRRKGGKQSFNSLSEKIENIKIGDIVLSYNEEKGIKEWDEVTNVQKRRSSEFVTIKFSNGNQIRCTLEHPFAVPNGNQIHWTKAKDLVVGDKNLQYVYLGLGSRIRALGTKGKTYDEIYDYSTAEKIRKICSDNLLERRKSLDFVSRIVKSSHTLVSNIKRSISMKKAYLRGGNLLNRGDKISKSKKGRPSSLKGRTLDNIHGFVKAEFLRLNKKELWNDPQYRKKCLNIVHNNITFPERKTLDVLNKVCPSVFEYNGFGNIVILSNGFAPDFVDVSRKKCIEVFGDYWHGSKKTSKSNEEESNSRIQLLKDQGWDCLVIWEREIKNNIQDVENKIVNFCYNPKMEIVEIVSIEQDSNEEWVYNFETKKNHNYFSYGILVHNCNVFLSQSIIPEIYIFSIMMMLFTYWAFISKREVWMAVLAGLAAGTHPIVFIAVALMVFLGVKKRWWWIPVVICTGLYSYCVLRNDTYLGFSPYAFELFWGDFGNLALSQFPERLRDTGILLCTGFGLALIPAILYLVDVKKSWLYWLFGIIPLFYWLCNQTEVTFVHFLLIFPWIAISAGLGLEKIKIKPALIFSCSLLLLLIMPFFYDIGNNLDEELSAQKFYEELSSVPDGSMIVDVIIIENSPMTGADERTMVPVWISNRDKNRNLIDINIARYLNYGELGDAYRSDLRDKGLNTPVFAIISLGSRLSTKGEKIATESPLYGVMSELKKANPDRRMYYTLIPEGKPMNREFRELK